MAAMRKNSGSGTTNQSQVNRPASRTRYYSNNSRGIKRRDPEIVVPYQNAKTPNNINGMEKKAYESSREMGKPNRNAPVQELKYYRKKGKGR